MITFLIFLDTLPSVLALELRQLETCSLFLFLQQLLHYLTGDHRLVVAVGLVTLVPAVEVPVTDVLPRDPETARRVLLGAKRSTLVVRVVFLAVVCKRGVGSQYLTEKLLSILLIQKFKDEIFDGVAISVTV